MDSLFPRVPKQLMTSGQSCREAWKMSQNKAKMVIIRSCCFPLLFYTKNILNCRMERVKYVSLV